MAVGIDDFDVIEAVRCVAKVEGRNDLGRVYDLKIHRCEFGKTRTHELNDGAGIEPGAGNREGDKAAGATLILHHIGDAEGDGVNQEGDRRVRSRLRLPAEKDVVHTRLRGRDDRRRVWLQGPLRTGIKLEAPRHRVEPEEDVVGCVFSRGRHAGTQRLALADRHLEKPLPSCAQGGLHGDTQL